MIARVAGLLLASLALAPGTALAADPPLTVPAETLQAALSCTQPRHGDRPTVLLVHGTGTDTADTWSWNYQRVLPAAGWDVCAVDLPERALGDIQVSSEYVVYAVRSISQRTGRKVSIMGHSQGGLEPRWAIKWWGAVRGSVEDLIQLAPPNHGVAATFGCNAAPDCWPAVWQMHVNAEFLAALNDGDETPGAPSYTSVYSQNDELVQPFTTVPLAGGSAIALQSICPGRSVQHGPILGDAVAYAVVIDALEHAGPAARTRITDLTLCARSTMPGVTNDEALAGNRALYEHAAAAFSQGRRTQDEPELAPYATGTVATAPAQPTTRRLTVRQRCRKRYPRSKRKQRQCIRRHRAHKGGR